MDSHLVVYKNGPGDPTANVVDRPLLAGCQGVWDPYFDLDSSLMTFGLGLMKYVVVLMHRRVSGWRRDLRRVGYRVLYLWLVCL